jgi:hypothetical protein
MEKKDRNIKCFYSVFGLLTFKKKSENKLTKKILWGSKRNGRMKK